MFYHEPIRLDDIIKELNIKSDGIYFDGTMGGGGHSLQILASGGRLLATDLDRDAVEYASKRFNENGFEGRYTIVRDNFKNFLDILEDNHIDKIDGAVLDLGISSHQIDEGERGFSYRFDARLDMRMDNRQELSAYEVVNNYSKDELIKILYEYGQEQYTKRIVGNIIKERMSAPIETTKQLSDIIEKSTPYIKNGHPAKKTFQAIRIEVNKELIGLESVIEDIVSKLAVGGRLCILSFHSLEDKIVKKVFRTLSTDCICPPHLPICMCNHKADVKKVRIDKKASDCEMERNSRSTCATLRIVEKL